MNIININGPQYGQLLFPFYLFPSGTSQIFILCTDSDLFKGLVSPEYIMHNAETVFETPVGSWTQGVREAPYGKGFCLHDHNCSTYSIL